ncbi:hypothetical protein ABL78_4449 [Leptomonas seymouri]|uniref:Uncharacterized protein n=1 Tax=Leptomonas seymouri TaxID=5684 RepID=A0A0N1HWJ7_LEPSE|nr:hypothetical protein ABL78_4449 [Leptomonas seymouri]|eukprot:KPI86465.1 hypothetical protein ABL78_4449 [Leptomonas seymouri]
MFFSLHSVFLILTTLLLIFNKRSFRHKGAVYIYIYIYIYICSFTRMAFTCSHVLKCTVLPVGKVLSLAVPQLSLVAIQTALSNETACAAEAFSLYVKNSGQFVSLTPDFKQQDSFYALFRCRGGGKGGFRKQLEKKGREFARAKMKERRNNAKVETKKEVTGVTKKNTQTIKAKVPKTEISATRTLVKQGLAFVIGSYQKGGATTKPL